MTATARRALAIGLMLSAGALPTRQAAADPVADFYRGKTIAVISAGSAGAAYGTYAQVIAAHFRKHVPGNPSVVVQFMVGAAGIRAMNYLANAAPRDGTAIGAPLQDIVLAARLGTPGVQFDPAQMHFLGGADITRATISVMKGRGIESIEDARRQEVLMGASGPSAQPYTLPTLVNALLGTRFKVITGYAGLAEIHIAMERGELHGRGASWQSLKEIRRDWIRDGRVVHLITVDLVREPDLPDVPALGEHKLSPEERTMVALVGGIAEHGRAWIAPTGVPAERVAALREAFFRTVHDPELVAEARARNLELRPVRWEEQQRIAGELMATPQATIERLRQILAPK